MGYGEDYIYRESRDYMKDLCQYGNRQDDQWEILAAKRAHIEKCRKKLEQEVKP